MAITLDGSNGITTPGGATTDDITFADNDKAIFGAGSDLQIYHDGTNSFISDESTGNLVIRGSSEVSIQDPTGSRYSARFIDTDAVRLYHNGSEKLATTSTGIDVTGSASTDGIKITNPLSGSFYNAKLEFTRDGTSGGAKIQSERNSAGGVGMSFNYTANNTAEVNATYTKAMTIDSSGNLLVANTTASSSDTGHIFSPTGIAFHVRDGGIPLVVDRLSNDGDLQLFRKDGTNVGSIANKTRLYMAGTDMGIYFGPSYIAPVNSVGTLRDNQYDLGDPSYRWDDIYATNGTIQTSDFNEKQDIASLTATEMLVGKRLSVLFKTFRWKDSVAEKGDNARTHTGVIAQDVQAAFTAEGLDAGDYAMFISNTWWEHDVDVPAVEAVAEVTDEDGNVTTEAVEAKDAYTRTDTYDTEAEAPEGATSKTRLGIRYPELLSFVAAYNEQRFASIEARLTALEA